MPYDKEKQLKSLKQYITLHDEEDTELYGLFHSAEIEDLWFNLDFWGLQHSSLLDGEEAEDLKTVCAYLVKLDPEHESFDILLSEFGNNNSLYFHSTESFEWLLKKFKSLHQVYTEYGESALKLFYVPRIFRNYISQTNLERQFQYLNGIQSYYCESSMAYELEQFQRNDDEYIHTIHSIEGYEYDSQVLPNIHTPVSFAGVRS